MAKPKTAKSSILSVGRNCMAVARADHALVIVDGKDYFADIRVALQGAEEQIVFVGWDFDTRVCLDGGTGSETLRAFVVRLLKSKKQLRIYILKWNFGALKILFRGRMILTIARWMASNRLRIKFDGVHPVGASHHQKLIIIDGGLAFCGGIDVTSGRWDDRAHEDCNPRRVTPDGKPADPWHDSSLVFDGAAARKLHELASDRWQRATKRPLPKVGSKARWPFGDRHNFSKVQLAIARTRGEYGEEPAIRENEALFLDMIASAKKFIYAENQYFASRTIAAAIARRLSEDDPPEFVLIMPESADGWLEQVAMDTARNKLVALLDTVDRQKRFRIYHPFTAGGSAIYVHAKLMIVDDRMIRIGSSNMNNRSLGFDSECDVVIDSALDSDDRVAGEIASIRMGLLAEHLGVEVGQVTDRLSCATMIETIEELRGPGRSLRPFAPEKPGEIAALVADQNLLDPGGDEDTAIERDSLSRRWWHRRPTSGSAR